MPVYILQTVQLVRDKGASKDRTTTAFGPDSPAYLHHNSCSGPFSGKVDTAGSHARRTTLHRPAWEIFRTRAMRERQMAGEPT